ncbi:SDR family NAD(P)-dependent oxidoreductase [Leucobacter luti]|uniref:NAD(P)-dependent dehydrogenase (Short-subunit alcohol dehydrogenase family) n=1 Tax=Leucobacter luti TaxID=340320 RepID=A0A4Q7U4K3_9MICO|nr:SDR family NAD(P)-dependent oxidoreductase [Leucobacter luti]MBL3699550.1 SDR family NAD(P)-dependent oxidoreductase [Leucobacter luti]RZT67062.1 NAD(P)-dependent dehydrogenase (short-subunit alcohol dehydrogenase family) [Leucobacter luti]
MNTNTELRFDGRVAVITGAGRGLGRAHALLLAARGARVVVNDFGGSHEGEGASAGPANDVVAEIVAAGGEAVADTNDIGTEAGCHALIETAITAFGRTDIVVNNAGISRWATFPEADADNLERTLDVHVRGTWHTTRAAWPHMVEQQYGRIITTTSTGMFGLPANLAYATAKGAVIGFTRSLAVAAEPLGIRVNCLAPNAITRPSENLKKSDMGAASRDLDEARLAAMDSAFVAPMAAFLAHESCDVNGEILVAGAKRYARWFLGVTEGWLDDGDAGTALEDIAAHFGEITDPESYYIPANLNEWATRFMSHLSH